MQAHYSAEQGFLNDEEILLLKGMAGSWAQGYGFLRTTSI